MAIHHFQGGTNTLAVMFQETAVSPSRPTCLWTVDHADADAGTTGWTTDTQICPSDACGKLSFDIAVNRAHLASIRYEQCSSSPITTAEAVATTPG